MVQTIEQTVGGVAIHVEYARETDAPVSEKEIRAYIARAHDLYPHEGLNSLKLTVDGEEVGINYGLEPVPFDRVRRITGYLVGTMDRWNNAKTSEEYDRVKHGVKRSEAVLTCSNGN